MQSDGRGSVSAWAGSFPEGDLRRSAFQEIVGAWAARDIVSAGKWLAGLAASPSRDAAVGTYVEHLSEISAAQAAPWAESIADQEARVNTIGTVARAWMMVDRPAAEAWLAKANLSQEQKQAVLNSGNSEGPLDVSVGRRRR